MDKKKAAGLVVFLSLISCNILAMKKDKKDFDYIQFQGKELPVAKDSLKDFDTFKAETNFYKNSESKNRAIKKISAISFAWDVTDLINGAMAADMPQENKLHLVKCMLAIVSKKSVPQRISDKQELFNIIKAADLLKNKTIMPLCAPILMKKLIGKSKFEFSSPVRILEKNDLEFHQGNNVNICLKNSKKKLGKSAHSYEKKAPHEDDYIICPKTFEVFLKKDSKKKKNKKRRIWKFGGKKGFKGVFYVLEQPETWPTFLPNQTGFVAKARDRKWKLWKDGIENPIQEFKGVDPNASPKILPNSLGFIAKAGDGMYKLWMLGKELPTISFDGLQEKKFTFLTDGSGFAQKVDGEKHKLWKINPFEGFTFQQLSLCFEIFESKHKKKKKRKMIIDMDDVKALKNLPKSLKKEIRELSRKFSLRWLLPDKLEKLKRI